MIITSRNARSFVNAASLVAFSTLTISPSFAATLLAGDNSLTTQVHADPTSPVNATTVFGLTSPGDVRVSFTSDSTLDITGGSGYAQINDFNAGDANTLDNLSISLTTSPTGFSAIEFTIQYASALVSNASPGLLTITANFLGGGSQSFSFNSSDPILNNLSFANAGARDFRLQADPGQTFASMTVTSNVAFEQFKQTDIGLAATSAVPEPATWLMMIVGFGFIGGAMRRKTSDRLANLKFA